MPHALSPFSRFDADTDGKITEDEVMQVFAKVDSDGDGSITKEELLKSLHAATSQRPDAGPHAQGDRPTGPPGSREGARAGRPNFERGPMSSGPFRGAGRQGPPSPSLLLNQFDKNKDGKLTKSELPGFLWDRLSKADKNGDGEVSKDEIEFHMKTIRPDGTSKPEERRSDDKPAPEAAKEAKSA